MQLLMCSRKFENFQRFILSKPKKSQGPNLVVTTVSLYSQNVVYQFFFRATMTTFNLVSVKKKLAFGIIPALKLRLHWEKTKT